MKHQSYFNFPHENIKKTENSLINSQKRTSISITKTSLIDLICKNSDLPKQEATCALESLLEIDKQTLESGEDLLVTGFGKFTVKEKKKRRGRNPQTDNCLVPDTKWIITFKCSDKLRKNLNDNNKK